MKFSGVAGDGAFVTTQWSVVLAAQGASPVAEEALEKLCRTYWRPIFSFVRRDGRTVADAQDLTQSFFARLLERRDFAAVRREKGRLRSYLLGALKHFLVNERERTQSQKRGGGRPLVSLDEVILQERKDPEPADLLSADKIYERRWALTVLERVLGRLEEEYRDAGHAELFGHFTELLGEDSRQISRAQIAAEVKMSENALHQAYYRFRRHYRQLLREEIAQTVAMPGDVDDELNHLITVLRT